MPVIKQRQTVLDFTTQHSGTMEALFVVAVSNGIGITDDIAPGTELTASVVEQKTVSFYAKSLYDITTIAGDQLLPGGIGYMQIGTSFKVS